MSLMRLARARNQAARSGLYFMAKRSKALPAAMAIEPSITAPVSAVPEEMHNDPEFWRTQAKMAKLDGRVTLANEAELAAKRAERRTGKAPVVEAENPIDENAERQVVRAAAEREARKPRTPQVAPLNGMAALGVAPAAVETGEVQSPSPEEPIAAEIPVEDAPAPEVPAKAKRVSARAKAKALDVANAEPPAIEEPTPIAVPASPVLENGLTTEEEATYQALAARRKPEPKSLTVKPGSITDRILAMLKDAGGHSVQEISDAMGWNKPSGQIIKIIRSAPFPVTMAKGADGRNRYTAG